MAVLQMVPSEQASNEPNAHVHAAFARLLNDFAVIFPTTECVHHVWVMTEDGERCDVCGVKR